jgi:hypothetical protein
VVRARLASTAIDFPPPGEDSTNGAGRLDCFQALGPPDALCKDVTVPTDPGVCQAAVASIDDGSFDTFDPGGTPSVILAQSPLAPYSLGETSVDLTATDANGLFDTCTAKVTVVDLEAPAITCPADLVVPNDPGQCSAVELSGPGGGRQLSGRDLQLHSPRARSSRSTRRTSAAPPPMAAAERATVYSR